MATPSATDYLLKVGNPGTATTLSAPGYTTGVSTTINVGSTANMPNDDYFVFAIDTATVVNGVQVRTAGSYCVFIGLVASATSISGVALLYGTPQNYAASALTRVYIPISSIHTNRLIDGLRQSMNNDGTLKQAAVKTALGVSSTTGGGWDILNAGTAPTVASGYNNGNKEYKLTFAGVDLTSTLSAGMRLKFDRGTTAPTQSMSFTAASSQYATKASPTGITFTSAFTCEAWVYLNSYAASDMIVISRSDNSTGGFGLTIKTTGQIDSWFWTSDYISYQSIPLKRWVHVAGVRSGTTGHIYLNGVEVPGSMTGAGSTFTQVGPLNIGAINNTSKFFDGFVSEARVWSAAQTATQIADNMAISLTGSETNLVALFQGNGNFTDKTANGNTLTATGGAIATQAANPYNTTEYAIVTKVAYATSTTTVTVFTGTDYNIPLGILINPFSSFQRSPFGFPASQSKWRIDAIYATNQNQSVANVTWANIGSAMLTLPIGSWRFGYQATIQSSPSSGSSSDFAVSLGTVLNAAGDIDMTYEMAATNGSAVISPVLRYKYIDITTDTAYYLNLKNLTGVTATMYLRGDSGLGFIFAECAYL